MKVVLDTNVIISAFATRGICSDMFEYCLQECELVMSNYIMREVESHLFKTVKLPKEIIKEIKNHLNKEAMMVKTVKLKEIKCRDKKDIPIIEAAVAGKANIIITGDKDLLKIKKYKSVSILTPREFWNLLKRTNKKK